MNFEDEHYVRIYTRDTKTWLKWGWEGQTVFCLLDRKFDKAGVLDDVDDPIEDVALITGLPVEVVAVGMPRLLASGTFEYSGNKLVCPKYIPANTAKKSDRLRAQDSRERRAAAARHGGSQGVTTETETVENRDDASQNVTESHDSSRGVTPRSLIAVHSSSDHSNSEDPKAADADPRPPSRSSLVPQRRQQLSKNLEEALKIPVQERAKTLIESPHLADWAEPHKWPELLDLAERFSTAMGWHEPRFLRPQGPVLRLAELLATFTADELTKAVERAPRDAWLTTGSKGLGSLSPEVVRRLLSAEKATEDQTDRKRREKIAAESEATFEKTLEIECEKRRKKGWSAEKLAEFREHHRRARREKLAS